MVESICAKDPMLAKALNIRTTVLHCPVIMIGTINWVTLEFHLVTNTGRFITTAMEMLKKPFTLCIVGGGANC